MFQNPGSANYGTSGPLKSKRKKAEFLFLSGCLEQHLWQQLWLLLGSHSCQTGLLWLQLPQQKDTKGVLRISVEPGTQICPRHLDGFSFVGAETSSSWVHLLHFFCQVARKLFKVTDSYVVRSDNGRQLNLSHFNSIPFCIVYSTWVFINLLCQLRSNFSFIRQVLEFLNYKEADKLFPSIPQRWKFMER